MAIYETQLPSGISRTKELKRTGLASYAVNVGTKCGHGCLTNVGRPSPRLWEDWDRLSLISVDAERAFVRELSAFAGLKPEATDDVET